MTLGRHDGFGEPEYSAPARRWPAMIDKDSRVAADCKIGAETRIWQFASVIRGAVIGQGCTIAAGAIIDAARIGNRCLIGGGAFIPPGISISDDVFIGPHVVFCNDSWPDTSKEGFDLAALLSGEFETVRVEHHASIGASAVILPGVVISEYARVAAAAVVTRDVPPRCIYKRNGEIVSIDPNLATKRMRRA